MRFLVLGLVMALLANGCGQKGQLYFSDSPPPGVKPPKVETYKPVPYPKDAERSTGASDTN